MTFQGGCHCGHIHYRLDWPDDVEAIPARACDCSFCRAHGAVWTSHPAARLQLQVHAPAQLSRYRFGTGSADFLVCAHCGVVTAAVCEVAGNLYAVVNVNTLLDPPRQRLQSQALSVQAEDITDKLARRRRGWIGTVRITEG